MAGYHSRRSRRTRAGTSTSTTCAGRSNERTAGLMLTNPSTLGLFDEGIEEVARIFHDAGALLYYDGANLNAVVGRSRPGDMGFDIVHYNLHKTFSQPHGGGGPGAGRLPSARRSSRTCRRPTVVRDGDAFRLDHDRPKSIGRVRGFAGPFGVFVRSYAYMRAYGPELREMSEVAVLNANYLLARLRDAYDLPYDRHCMHEFVLSARNLKREHGITALDVAKRLMDYGIHPPTVYFPLVVPEALMIEPTETEPKERLDDFVDAMLAIAREAAESPESAEGGAARAPGPPPRRGARREAAGLALRLRRAPRARRASGAAPRARSGCPPGRPPSRSGRCPRGPRPCSSTSTPAARSCASIASRSLTVKFDHRVLLRRPVVRVLAERRPDVRATLSCEDDVAVGLHGHADVLRVPGDERLRVLRPEEDASDARHAFHRSSWLDRLRARSSAAACVPRPSASARA